MLAPFKRHFSVKVIFGFVSFYLILNKYILHHFVVSHLILICTFYTGMPVHSSTNDYVDSFEGDCLEYKRTNMTETAGLSNYIIVRLDGSIAEYMSLWLWLCDVLVSYTLLNKDFECINIYHAFRVLFSVMC